MSFWPFCCKKPQAHAINPDRDELRQQFCVEYGPVAPAAGRPGGAESLSVAGARSGRVVTNPIKFKSLCNFAGVSEDGKLYAWSDEFTEAMRYQNSHARPVERDFSQRFARRSTTPTTFVLGTEPEGFSGLYQVGDDDDWDSVVSGGDDPSPGGSFDLVLAKKTDGSLWSFGDWQSGVQCYWGRGDSGISSLAFRAKLNSSVASIKTDFDESTFYRFGLPVWLTAEPQSVSVQKVRLHQRSAGNDDADVATANSEPGGGASVVSRLRAKIDVGAIRSVSVTSGGSGYTTTTRTVTLISSDGSGSDATAFGVVGSSGSITSVVITNPGEGYKHPVTATTAGASFSVAPPRRFLVTSGGSGYTAAPTVSFEPADGEYEDAGGATARVSKMSRCGVGAFEVLAGGTGYTTATAVETRTGATATAVVNEAGSIVSWNLTSAGAAAYSPLDDEPLAVTITGDGEGATATAVPAGSSVEEVEVVENPEVWSRPPLVVFAGGGGEGAAAVVEGVIGKLEFEVQSEGTGYTKTSFFGVGFGLPNIITDQSERTHYAPCVTVPASQDVVGGRAIGGSVIVGEAILSPSQVASIDQNAAEFLNPYRSPYRDTSGVTTSEQSLSRHHLRVATLTVASQGVVHPFRRTVNLDVDGDASLADALEIVQQTVVVYLRGPGHSRQTLTVEYVPGTLSPPEFVVSLASPFQSPQPPALCIEYLGRPHFKSPVGRQNLGNSEELDKKCQTVFLDWTEKPNAKQWWSRPDGNQPDSYFQPGAIEVTSDDGALHRYRIVDGSPFREHESSALVEDEDEDAPPPNVSVSAPGEYLGPVEERTLEDPCRSWWQPSDAQRIHFVFPTEQGVPARGLAEAIYDASLQHPVIGPVSLPEPGGGYTEEPEARIFTSSDPLPVNTGLTACTSAGFFGDGGFRTAMAVSQGSLKWWGSNSAIVTFSVLGLDPQPPASEGAAAFYAWRLATQGATSVTAKPTLVGGHLSFAASGELTAPTESGGDSVQAIRFMRLPRPAHGNRLPSFDDVFHPWPIVLDGTGNNLGSRPYVTMLPGVQSSTSSGLLYRHMPWKTRAVDHGFGYDGSASIQYVGPGLAPHTLSVTASVVANGITRVSRSGLLKHSSGKWFSPVVRSSQRGSLTPLPRTVVTAGSTTSACNSLTTVTVTDGSPTQTRDYAVVARTAGQGYRVGVESDWKEFGGSHISVTIASGQGYTFLWSGEGYPGGAEIEYALNVVPSGESYYGDYGTSFGGFRAPEVSVLVDRVTPPQVVSVNGGGQGAVVVVVEVIDPRSPLTPYCQDALSETVDPAGLLAVDTTGRLRAVSSGWLFEPEAFKDFPVVTGIEEVSALVGLQYPHSDFGAANYLVRDVSGRLWGIRMSNDAGGVGVTAFGVFLLSTSFGFTSNQITAEPHVPVALSPLAASLTNTGDGYDYPVKVDVSQPAGVAKGTTTIDGKLVGVAVFEGGSGYKTPPTVAFAGNAAAEAEIAGPVQSIEVTSGGNDYRLPPKVRFSTPGVPARATATMQDGQVQSVTISSGGMYRQAPEVLFDPDFDIESISVTAGGQKYSTPPAVFIDGGATATAQISCSVVRVTLVSPGSGYTTTPVITITGGGGAGAFAQAILDPANGTIALINVVSGGTGYTTPPTIMLSGGGGSGAAGRAEIEGLVSSITLGSRGSGYDRAPAVVVSGGGGTGATATAAIAAVGSGATATATINGSVVAVRVTNPGSNYQRPPVVSFVRAIPAVAGDVDAVAKAVILGRPQSIAVQADARGSGYCNPFFSTELSPGSKRRTPSRQIRRPIVSAKGSFYPGTRSLSRPSFYYTPPAKDGGVHYWLNTYPLLGLAELQGGDSDAGGSVSSVTMPQFVVGLNITNAGSGYTPDTLVGIRVSSSGTLDNRFRLFNLPLQVNEPVAEAYIGKDGRIAGIVSQTDRIAAYTSPPTFALASGNGAVTAILGHPLQCYYAPQVLFDGAIEMDADMSLTLAGACVEGNGTLPRACCGDEEFPYWVGTARSTVQRNSLLTAAIFLDNRRPDLRLRLVGTVAGFNRRSDPGPGPDGPNRFSSEDQALRTDAFGFYSTPPQVIIEDEKGSGATIATASLPASGKATVSPWIESCSVSAAGSGYTLGARLRIVGGRPLAWDNPASASAAFDANGRIASLTLQQGGKGYTSPPTVYIVGDGSGARAVVDAIDPDTGAVTAVRIESRGAGYTSATVVFVDKETTADKSETVARVCSLLDRKYAVLLEGCKIESATIPPERRRERTTLAVREVFSCVEVGPSDSIPADYKTTENSAIFANPYLDIEAAGYKLHGAYLSDGHVEYVRVEHHFGELPPTPTVITITPTSDVQPSVVATAVAAIPACDNVFSGTVANVTTDLPPYQVQAAVLPLVFDLDNDSTYSGDIAGVGNVTKRGTGTLTLTGRLTFSGSLVIQGGTVVVKSL